MTLFHDFYDFMKTTPRNHNLNELKIYRFIVGHNPNTIFYLFETRVCSLITNSSEHRSRYNSDFIHFVLSHLQKCKKINLYVIF